MRLSQAVSGAGEHAPGRKSALRPILLGFALALLAFLFVHPPRIAAGGIDFTAFYCASRAISNGENPYRYEPLHSCEHVSRRWTTARSIVVAPLPPYALALLAPLGRLPYAQAGFVWLLLLVGGAIAIIWAIIDLTGLSLLAVGIPIVIAVLLQSLPTGALAPIPLALLTVAAVTLAWRRWNATAVLLGFACVEPHVALPVMLAVFVLVTEMRLRLAVVAVTLIALSLISGGVALNTEYFADVLGGHARFELGSIVQFGLSSMLHNFGVPDSVSLAIGSAQYALFIVLGIWLAKAWRARHVSMVILVPMALAVIGGVYIHLTQLAAVLPLAFVIASQTRSVTAWLGIALLTVPWNLLGGFTPNTLYAPRIGDALSQALHYRYVPGETSYIANLLAYAGVGCILVAALSSFRKARVALR